MGFLSSLGNVFSSLFGGSNGGSDIFKAILGGIGGSADAKLMVELAEKKAKAEGVEQRKSLDFSAQLEDYYGQLNKNRKRVALDTYGQFDLTKRWAPSANVTVPPVQVPTKPVPN